MRKHYIKSDNLFEHELKSVAQIHIEAINSGFLSQLGPNFLFYLYKSINECPETQLIIAKDNDLTIGFITGCSSLKPAFKHLLKNYFIKTSISLLPKIFSFSTFKRIFEIIMYSNNEKDFSIYPSAELLSLAVIDSYRGNRVAESLYKQLKIQFQKHEISEFKIIVGEDLLQAQRFYEKMEAIKIGTTDLHKNNTSFIYKATVN